MRNYKYGTKSPYDASIDALVDDLANPASDVRMAALFGPWGSGKSTALSFVKQHFDAEGRGKGKMTHVEVYDAWEERYSPTPILNVLAKLVEPDPLKDWTEQLSDGMRERIAAIISGRGARYGGILLRLLGKFGPKELRDDEKALAENLEELDPEVAVLSDIQNHAHTRSVYASRGELFQKIEELALAKRSLNAADNLWVIVDNLDRCPSNQLLDLLEAFQYSAGLKSVRLLFALDPIAAAKAICSRYPSFSEADATAYLDKVFFPIHRMPKFNGQEIAAILNHNRGQEVLALISRRTGANGLTLNHIAYACEALFANNARQSINFMHQFASWAAQYSTLSGLPFDGDWFCTAIAIGLVGAKPEVARLLVGDPQRFHRLIHAGNPKERTGLPLELEPWHARMDAVKVYSESDPIAQLLAQDPRLYRALGAFIRPGDSQAKGNSRAEQMAVLMKRLLSM